MITVISTLLVKFSYQTFDVGRSFFYLLTYLLTFLLTRLQDDGDASSLAR